MSDSFEVRLANELRAFADARTRPVDAMAVAQRAIGNRVALPWRAAMPPRLRLGALLAAAAVTLLLIGYAFGVGSSRRPLPEPSPTRSGPAFVLPTPVSSSELASSVGGLWWLDWGASGLTVPHAGGPNGPEVVSLLIFTPNAVLIEQGAGGGCDQIAAPYALDGGHLTIDLAATASTCTEREAITAVQRVGQTASFTRGTEPCALPFADPQASTAPNPACRTLRLLNANGQLLSVYRQLPDEPGACCVPTPDPGLVQVSANRWRLDWAASGLDGHVNSSFAAPILSTLDVDTSGAFAVWQGYDVACDHVVGTVGGRYPPFTFKVGVSGCDPVATQAVRDQLARADAYFVDVDSCGGDASGAGSTGSCPTLHIDSASGSERLVYRAMP
jgi:hypothetical protein